MSITRRRIEILERHFGGNTELEKALAAALAAPPHDFGSFIGAAMSGASERQLKSVAISPEITQKFFAAQYLEILDEWLAEADAGARVPT